MSVKCSTGQGERWMTVEYIVKFGLCRICFLCQFVNRKKSCILVLLGRVSNSLTYLLFRIVNIIMPQLSRKQIPMKVAKQSHNTLDMSTLYSRLSSRLCILRQENHHPPTPGRIFTCDRLSKFACPRSSTCTSL